MRIQNNYNPDVLSCLANLSSDEVFTPPKLANEILDLLPKELWKDKNATFLDPVCKSGVFLREIATRLLDGLKDQIPDVQKRIDHIYKNQLFGIGITELTSLLARRSLYCSKTANAKYSVSRSFKDAQGNIFFDETKHGWQNGRCSYCGTSQSEYEREEGFETHAYQFIHNKIPNIINNMKFDVIIGNPPYQLSDSGARASAKPLYHLFVQQAQKLNPRFLTMIIPSRWYSGGKGLDEFRREMLSDNRLRKIVDYFDSTECFPGVDISGGICYFLWNRDARGLCEVTTVRSGSKSTTVRPLQIDGSDTFVRFNEAVDILNKVRNRKEASFSEFISSRKPFGITTDQRISEAPGRGLVKIYSYPKNGYFSKFEIKQNKDALNRYKVFVSYAYGERGAFPYLVTGKPFLGEPGTCCSETYLMVGPLESKRQCENVMFYMTSRFFRFLVLMKKNTQHATSKVYEFVPVQDFKESWNDEKLYKKYRINKEEIAFIESLVRPMSYE